MKKSRWLTAAIVAVVFLLGALTGGFATRAMQQSRLRELIMGDPAELRNELFLHALDTRLRLTPEQRARATAALAGQSDRYREALELSRPRIRELRGEVAAELAPSLSAEQRAVLDVLIREGERHR